MVVFGSDPKVVFGSDPGPLLNDGKCTMGPQNDSLEKESPEMTILQLRANDFHHFFFCNFLGSLILRQPIFSSVIF